MRRRFTTLCGLAVLGASAAAGAVTSTESVPSSLGGNGHNVSFDGRLFLVRDAQGLAAQVLRPEAVTYGADGLPDATGPMWSPRVHIITAENPDTIVENAIAICEPEPARAPYACDEAGAPAATGPHACYDVWILDSDAVTPAGEGGLFMRRRHLLLWVADPDTPNARVHKVELSSALEQLSPTIRGIEPTVTADGRLMVWQGHPDNDGKIDILMYSVNATACAAAGWSAPRVLSQMATDPAVVGVYPLADKALRAADGTTFASGDLFHGAYPWLFADGSALVFTASNMPCRATEDPPGCGPRRNSWAVVGYPSNWGIAIVDGGVNPASDDTVRLFFSSPGPEVLAPVTEGLDVWPFFGSNTSNYVELVFDDGLDGNYAGFWHFNENVTRAGELDRTRVPDVSGYFNTGRLLGGLEVAARNDGVLGRALTFDGIDDRVEVDHSITLEPVNGITIEFYIRPTADPNCDERNNYRLLLSKGDINTGIYTVVLEQSLVLQTRFRINGEQQSLVSPPLPLDEWTHVACEYDGPSGAAGCFFDGTAVVSETFPTGTLTPSGAPLTIGAPGPRAACPDGDGAFAGMLDELAISRYARRLGQAPGAPDGGPLPGADAGAGASPDASGPGIGDGDGDGGGGCGCRAGGGASGAGWFVLLALSALIAAGRTRVRPGPARRRGGPATPRAHRARARRSC